MHSPLLFSLAAGILPAIVWIWFWRKEDRASPEPRFMILFAFLAGMLTVPLVLPAERAVYHYLGDTMLTIVLWAAIEEISKAIAGFVGGASSRYADEPIDAVVYFITAALGFSALENALFILRPASEGNLLLAAVTGNMRFVGATLLHTIASAAIGVSIAASFYRHRRYKKWFVVMGISAAIALHTAFNFFIMHASGYGIYAIFSAVWILIIALLIILDRIKRRRRCKI